MENIELTSLASDDQHKEYSYAYGHRPQNPFQQLLPENTEDNSSSSVGAGFQIAESDGYLIPQPRVNFYLKVLPGHIDDIGSAQIEGDIENIYETIPENSQPMHVKMINETTNPLRTRILNKKLMQYLMMIIIGAAIVIIPGALCYAFLDLNKSDCAIQVNESEMERMKMENIKLKKELTEANETLFQSNESITSKNITIMEISKLQTELAAEKNLTDQLRDCLNRNISSERSRELLGAARDGRTVDLLRLLQDCENPNGIWGGESSALWIASRYGHIEAATELIKYGANVNYARWDGLTPLMIAAGNGHLKIVKLLLAHKAKVNDVKRNKQSAIHYAAWYGHVDVLKELIASGGDVTAKDVFGWTPLSRAAQSVDSQNKEKIVEILKAAGAKE